MSALSAGHRPTTLNQGALYGLRTAFLHVTAACEKKWEPKWKPGTHGAKQEDSWSKGNSNNAKRKKRADSKRDLPKWRFLNFSLCDFFEIRGSHGFRSSKAQGQQNDGKKYSHRWSSENGRSSKKKGHKRNFDEEGPSFEVFRSSPLHFFWQCDTSDQSQWWGHTWEYTSWQGKSSCNSSQTEKKRLNTETTVGSVSDRQALGLCPTGPLTVEELKKAFRLSALKWHPDRHQGSAKVKAEAKFKQCGAAYKSLLDALASA